MTESAGAADSMDGQIQKSNDMVMAQINSHLKSGLGAALAGQDYCVIRREIVTWIEMMIRRKIVTRREVTEVCFVVPSSTVADKNRVVFGPESPKKCFEYVNLLMVTRLAERDSLEAGKHTETEPENEPARNNT
jgi:hypothetical protein